MREWHPATARCIHPLWPALQVQALQREVAAAAETRRQLHRRLQHDAQQHLKHHASLEAGTCKLREDLTAAQQKVSNVSRTTLQQKPSLSGTVCLTCR